MLFYFDILYFFFNFKAKEKHNKPALLLISKF